MCFWKSSVASVICCHCVLFLFKLHILFQGVLSDTRRPSWCSENTWGIFEQMEICGWTILCSGKSRDKYVLHGGIWHQICSWSWYIPSNCWGIYNSSHRDLESHRCRHLLGWESCITRAYTPGMVVAILLDYIIFRNLARLHDLSPVTLFELILLIIAFCCTVLFCNILAILVQVLLGHLMC